jgi:hypothetical protein
MPIIPTQRDADALRQLHAKVSRLRGPGMNNAPGSLALSAAPGQAPPLDRHEPQHWLGVITDNTTLGGGIYKVAWATFQVTGSLPIATPFPAGDPRGHEVEAVNLDELGASGHSLPVGTAVVLFWTWGAGVDPIKTFYFRGGPAVGTMFAVMCWKDGGTTDGDATNQCNRTYTVRTQNASGISTGGTLLGTGMTPKLIRPTLGTMLGPATVDPSATGPGVVGQGYYDATGTFQLFSANEVADGGC